MFFAVTDEVLSSGEDPQNAIEWKSGLPEGGLVRSLNQVALTTRSSRPDYEEQMSQSGLIQEVLDLFLQMRRRSDM